MPQPRGQPYRGWVGKYDSQSARADFGDMLDYLAVDPHTRAILLYVERFTHGRKFMSAARLASRIKPVVVLKAGRSEAGARAAATRIDPVAGADTVFDTAFRRAGMLRVATMAVLFAAAETLALTREQAGDRVAILTNGGGVGILAADTLVAAGGQMAELSQETLQELDRRLPATWRRGNPIDIAGDSPGTGYGDALAALIRDPAVDAIMVLNCPTALARPDETARAVIDAIGAAEPGALRGRNIITQQFGIWPGKFDMLGMAASADALAVNGVSMRRARVKT
jgi:acetyltransferase